MACDTTIYGGPTPVWSGKSDSAAIFIHLTDWVRSVGVDQVRFALELRSNSGNCEVTPGFQTADEETSPDAGQAVSPSPTWYSNDDMHYEASYTSISVAQKQLVRFGLMVRNTSGTNLEALLASIRVDIIAP